MQDWGLPRMREGEQMSKMRLTGVQNEGRPLRGSGKREKGPSGKYETGKYIPVFHDSQITKTECRPGVQNEGNRCPKWRSPRILELKVESEKSMELESIMFNRPLNPRSDCPKCL